MNSDWIDAVIAELGGANVVAAQVLTATASQIRTAIKARKDALKVLAKHKRFKIVQALGDTTLYGYWPEHDSALGDAP